jgi:hypothetical protein
MRIPIEQQIIAILFSLILLLATVQLIRKHKLREEYALIWLAASIAVFVLTVFDKLVNFLAAIFAVSYPPTLILVLGVLFCLVLLLSQTVTLSKQADRIRDLAQSLGILEHRLRQLERGRSQPIFTPADYANADSLTMDEREEMAIRQTNMHQTKPGERL